MKNSTKRIVTILLAAVICISSLSVLTMNVFAEDDSANIKKGTFIFAPHTYMDGDLIDNYYYTDEFFEGSAFDYNDHLATMSMLLAASSISSQEPGVDYPDKSKNLEDLLSQLDFFDFEVNNYYMQKPKEQTMGVGVAYKVIGEGEDAYTLLAIVPRSAGYEKEWAGNFTVGKDGVHEGFATGRDIILEFTREYVAQISEEIKGDVKVWTVGYSRGAGVANLLAAYLNDNSDTLGIEIKKENIFAYTFGTPSTVQYANDDEKATLESNYKNIHNVYSDYDIIRCVPFKNWNFTTYGSTKLLDVYDEERKAEMLEFLKKTNQYVYDLYVADNSTADPDNFMAVMAQLSEAGITFVPADEEYDIPNNQRDFLDSRINFLVDNLLPDRTVYVDGGYQYALQKLAALYFGLEAAQMPVFTAAISANLPLMAISYYCYFLADFYLDTEDGVEALIALAQSLDAIKAYIMSEEGASMLGNEVWYIYATEFFESDEFQALESIFAMLEGNDDMLSENVNLICGILKNFAVDTTADVLGSGVMALELETDEKSDLFVTMTSDKVTEPLAKTFAYLLFGYDDDQPIDAFDPSNKSVSLAATFIYNAGRYMRVHNNEIIVSWLRTYDSYYTEDLHVHTYSPSYTETHHGEYCDCGASLSEEAHIMGDWTETKAATKDATGLKERRCACGYTESEIIPALDNNTLMVVIICAASATVVAVAVVITIAAVKNKRKIAK